MSITINGTTGISGVDGSSTTPAFQGTDTNTGLFYGTDIVGISTGGSERVRVDASGNVGIGTSSPAYRIDAFTNATSTTVGANTVAAFYSNGNGYDSNIRFGDNVNSNIRLGYISGSMYMYTNGAERMRIDSSGNVLVGTTSVLNAGLITEVFNGASQNGIVLKTTYASTGSTYITFRNSAGNEAGYITQNGTTTVNYVTSSDYRLKENIKPITNALDKVAQLKPVTYTWIGTNNEIGEGFIAHELAEICPLAVSGEKDAVDADGNPKYQGIDTSKLVATLTAAIQEQQTIINDLKARVTALEASNV